MDRDAVAWCDICQRNARLECYPTRKNHPLRPMQDVMEQKLKEVKDAIEWVDDLYDELGSQVLYFRQKRTEMLETSKELEDILKNKDQPWEKAEKACRGVEVLLGTTQLLRSSVSCDLILTDAQGKSSRAKQLLVNEYPPLKAVLHRLKIENKLKLIKYVQQGPAASTISKSSSSASAQQSSGSTLVPASTAPSNTHVQSSVKKSVAPTSTCGTLSSSWLKSPTPNTLGPSSINSMRASSCTLGPSSINSMSSSSNTRGSFFSINSMPPSSSTHGPSSSINNMPLSSTSQVSISSHTRVSPSSCSLRPPSTNTNTSTSPSSNTPMQPFAKHCAPSSSVASASHPARTAAGPPLSSSSKNTSISVTAAPSAVSSLPSSTASFPSTSGTRLTPSISSANVRDLAANGPQPSPSISTKERSQARPVAGFKREASANRIDRQKAADALKDAYTISERVSALCDHIWDGKAYMYFIKKKPKMENLQFTRVHDDVLDVMMDILADLPWRDRAFNKDEEVTRKEVRKLISRHNSNRRRLQFGGDSSNLPKPVLSSGTWQVNISPAPPAKNSPTNRP